ncbi:MAG: hypothetical protein P8N02_00085 [Actinomycetota bacterium]|nr:hypothetical protein [Actinomycetota bacterium]
MSDRFVRQLRRVLWSLSIISLVAGFFIGWYVHAQVGGAMWMAAVVFALAPFASHRNRHMGPWSR